MKRLLIAGVLGTLLATACGSSGAGSTPTSAPGGGAGLATAAPQFSAAPRATPAAPSAMPTDGYDMYGY